MNNIKRSAAYEYAITYLLRETVSKYSEMNKSINPEENCDKPIIYSISHIKEEDETYTCDMCESTFDQLCSLTQHKRTHSDEKLFKCDICKSAYFTQIDRLNQHKRIHSGKSSAVFNQTLSLKLQYKCDICDTGFSQMKDLIEHKRIHIFQCDVCGKGFSTFKQFKIHKRYHSDESYEPRMNKCDMCELSFLHLGNLNQHRRIHLGDKAFKCDICNASFNHLRSLHKHRLVHSAVKCNYCKLKFNNRITLNRHIENKCIYYKTESIVRISNSLDLKEKCSNIFIKQETPLDIYDEID